MAGGSKRVPNQPKTETESNPKEESEEEQSQESHTESKPEDAQKGNTSTDAEAKAKGKKPMSPKEDPPMEAAKKGTTKGIVIKEPETETVAKSGMKRKREFVVKSSYSLRSGLKGTGVDAGQQKVERKSAVRKVKGKKKVKEETDKGKKKEKESGEGKKKKKKEKETDDVEDEGSCKRQSKRLKRNDDKEVIED